MEIEDKIKDKIGINDKVVIYYYEPGKHWIAFSLETMLVGMGGTMDEAYKELKSYLAEHIILCDIFKTNLFTPMSQKERVKLVKREKKV